MHNSSRRSWRPSGRSRTPCARATGPSWRACRRGIRPPTSCRVTVAARPRPASWSGPPTSSSVTASSAASSSKSRSTTPPSRGLREEQGSARRSRRRRARRPRRGVVLARVRLARGRRHDTGLGHARRHRLPRRGGTDRARIPPRHPRAVTHDRRGRRVDPQSDHADRVPRPHGRHAHGVRTRPGAGAPARRAAAARDCRARARARRRRRVTARSRGHRPLLEQRGGGDHGASGFARSRSAGGESDPRLERGRAPDPRRRSRPARQRARRRSRSRPRRASSGSLPPASASPTASSTRSATSPRTSGSTRRKRTSSPPSRTSCARRWRPSTAPL